MNSNRALHFKYWIGILLAVIVLVAAAAWGADPKLAERINFAVGVTSVILALLAIYVTLAFSTLFSNNVVTFLSLNSRIEDSAAKLITATTDLNAKLETIPTGFRDLTQAVQDSSERLNTFIAERTAATTTEPRTATRSFPFAWTEDELASLYAALQYLAIVATYLVVHAHRRSRVISDLDLTAVNPAITSSYFLAVLGFLTALNLCTFQPQGLYAYSITHVNPLLETHVDTWITNLIAFNRQGLMTPQSNIIESGKSVVDRLMTQSSPQTPPTSSQSTTS